MQSRSRNAPQLVLALAVLFFLPSLAQAQSAEYSCPNFFHVHKALDCIEAIFSEDSAPLYTHFVVGSVPPGNGFALGLITENPIHFVSAFTPTTPPDMRDPNIFVVPSAIADPNGLREGGRKSYFVPRIGEAVSTDGSWYVAGGFDWMPGLYIPGHIVMPPIRPGLQGSTHPCHRLGKLCTNSLLTLHFNAGHSIARTIDFYGLGPASPGNAIRLPPRSDLRWPSGPHAFAHPGTVQSDRPRDGCDFIAVMEPVATLRAPKGFVELCRPKQDIFQRASGRPHSVVVVNTDPVKDARTLRLKPTLCFASARPRGFYQLVASWLFRIRTAALMAGTHLCLPRTFSVAVGCRWPDAAT
jgi:hypothetical protein